jgi:hypothetical protein
VKRTHLGRLCSDDDIGDVRWCEQANEQISGLRSKFLEAEIVKFGLQKELQKCQDELASQAAAGDSSVAVTEDASLTSDLDEPADVNLSLQSEGTSSHPPSHSGDHEQHQAEDAGEPDHEPLANAAAQDGRDTFATDATRDKKRYDLHVIVLANAIKDL